MRLLEKFNIKPNNIHLYQVAFLHESYAHEHGLTECYERLEFLGDAVLDLVVSEYLYKKDSNFNEGELTRLRSNYVCKQALYTYSIELGLHHHIKLGNGLEFTRREINSVTSDVFESFIGALYLDQGLETVKEFLSKTVIPHIDNGDIFFYDYKSRLKQLCDKDSLNITYRLINEEGDPHDKTFEMACVIDGKMRGTGTGGSKKEAEQNASKIALDTVSNH
ncbi:ribonuclease III [Methanobacterium petrolearium]|uniref:ribonuclease III n=1 Tax=Methanobacterium petrolearium TaxID=710190 RepID=UPI001AEAA676|nr:ribonuclease III [Methanobacterium petrolearium]MBP1946282.1 ribonuclease-3 [Methanobacterium petrolearium]BDZ71377.1 ribonuclease 3 [Methanobacterium petrolearium]